MRSHRARDNSLSVFGVALLLGACNSEAAPPASYSAGSGGEAGAAAGAGGSAGSAGAAGGSANAKPRCDLPKGWPTLESVLSLAEPLPDTGDVGHMVMTSRGLHWLADKALYRLGTDAKPVLVAMTDDGLFAQLDASSSAVVWLWGSSIWALSLDANATPRELWTEVSVAGDPILVDETNVYFDQAFGSNYGFWQIPLAGGTPKKVPIVAQDVFAVHDGYGYYKQSDSITGDLLMRAPLAGGTAEQVAKGFGFLWSPRVLFDANVMYVATDTIGRVEVGKPDSKSIVFHLAPSPDQGVDNSLTSMVLDGDRLVYADQYGTVGWVTTDGAQCANILVDPSQGKDVPGWPIEVALDDKYLYMLVFDTSSHGSLHRIARSKVGL